MSATSFDDLSRDFLADELDASPVTATALGLPGYDDRLPDQSADAVAARERRDDAWLQRLAGLDTGALTGDDLLDRDLIRSALHRRRALRGWAEWRRSPDLYSGPGLNGVHLLLLNRPVPDPELALAVATRLRAVPELLEQGRANLDPELAHPDLLRRAVAQARAGVGYTREMVPAEFADPQQRAAVAEAGELAAQAYAAWAEHLTTLAESASGDFALGETAYDAVLREAEGLDFGTRELRERGEAAWAELAEDLRRRTRDIAGDDDWRGLLGRLDAQHPPTPEAMRDAYAEWTERARAFCAERGLVTLPEGERCDVLPSVPFTRPMLAVAHYMQAPPFGARTVGTFYVPYPPEGATPEAVAQRMATNAYSSVPTISVHEAYPGHHWHLAYARATCKRPLRHALGTPYLSEGWALYAEQMLLEQGFFSDPEHALRQVDARLFRAARIIVDTSLHLGEMSIAEATAFMSTRASLSPDTARAEVLRYCAWPTQAPSYLTGALEIGRMARRWTGEGKGTLREFHDAVARHGRIPLGLVERSLFSA